MGHPAPSVTVPSSPPIYQSTAFDIADLDVLEKIHAGELQGDIYTRDSNPNHRPLRNPSRPWKKPKVEQCLPPEWAHWAAFS